MTSCETINIDIPAQSEYVGIVRLSVSGVASRMNFTIDDIDDIKIAVSEACTNVIKHAYSAQEDNRIFITYKVLPEMLEITVKDTGIGFDLSKKVGPKATESEPQIYGLGLGITFMESLMDELDVQSEIGKGTVVSLAKYRTAQSVTS